MEKWQPKHTPFTHPDKFKLFEQAGLIDLEFNKEECRLYITDMGHRFMEFYLLDTPPEETPPEELRYKRDSRWLYRIFSSRKKGRD